MANSHNIVVADKMEKEVVDKLNELGNVSAQPADLKASLADADVLIVRSATKVTEELLLSAPKLKVVARAGVGLDNVDKAACEKRGIAVINTPAASTEAVAELVIGLMIVLMRKVGFAHAALKQGRWVKGQCTGQEISGKTLGIVGMGRIGRSVAKKAEALGMKVLYNDVKQAPDLHYPFAENLDEMLPRCDVVSLHAAMPAGAPALMGKERLTRMKMGSYLVNAARGALVDEQALVAALQYAQEAQKSGRHEGVTIVGAALDVFQKEPKKEGEPFANSELLKLDNVLLTPHIGASTQEAQARIGEDLIAQLKERLRQ